MRFEMIKRSAEIKKERRIELGNKMSLLFENKDTVKQQVQEMVYLDKLSTREEIEREINIYSSWIPCGGKAKATLYIYAENYEELSEIFKTLKGIYNSIFLKVGDKLIQGDPEAGRDQGDQFVTIQMLTFDLQGEKSNNLEVHVIHENYRFKTALPETLAKKVIEEAYELC
nr:DUF3501 family protein [Acidianus sp. RZ1]